MSNGWLTAGRTRWLTMSRRVGPRLEDHGELVAAQAGHRVALADARPQALADGQQQRSPALWPRVSFATLESSRSMSSRCELAPLGGSRWATASFSRSPNRARLASPVSGSWWAR